MQPAYCKANRGGLCNLQTNLAKQIISKSGQIKNKIK